MPHLRLHEEKSGSTQKADVIMPVPTEAISEETSLTTENSDAAEEIEEWLEEVADPRSPLLDPMLVLVLAVVLWPYLFYPNMTGGYWGWSALQALSILLSVTGAISIPIWLMLRQNRLRQETQD